MWHDGSTIANHGDILFSVNIIYDPAVFYTREECKLITGNDIDVQSEIEKPELYMLGRCQSNDEQLGFIKSRVECLKDLSNNIVIDENFELVDVMRFFHGDGPANAIELGNQKGGHYFCPHCNARKCLNHDIAYSFCQKLKTYEGSRDKIIEGKYGMSNSLAKVAKPFSNLDGKQIQTELNSRKVFIGENLKCTKKDLLPILKGELKG